MEPQQPCARCANTRFTQRVQWRGQLQRASNQCSRCCPRRTPSMQQCQPSTAKGQRLGRTQSFRCQRARALVSKGSQSNPCSSRKGWRSVCRYIHRTPWVKGGKSKSEREHLGGKCALILHFLIRAQPAVRPPTDAYTRARAATITTITAATPPHTSTYSKSGEEAW